MATMPLTEVDKVEILTILDNTIDLLLPGNDAVIGGFHLSGALFEPIIAPTVATLKELNPELIAPAHCTGWKAVHAIARELPQAFVQNSVGTRFVL